VMLREVLFVKSRKHCLTLRCNGLFQFFSSSVIVDLQPLNLSLSLQPLVVTVVQELSVDVHDVAPSPTTM
jgi:hypothetical protein